MKIEGNTIIFSSFPVFFHKEKNGLKSNTIRNIKRSFEFKEFVKFKSEFDKIPKRDKYIQITNAVTQESFTRRLTDISAFEGHFIFSWREE